MKISGLTGRFFQLVIKTNFNIMSIKPSVVFIKGVHSTTGSDKTSDIGFPQLELEKLFEGATLKQIDSGTNYDSNKKYIYKNEAGNVAIQDEGHFNCIKNGYYSIANGVSHYYTLSGNNYNYNTVPDTSTWAGKWGFSNTIKDKTLYSINPELTRVHINDSYYEKNSDNYIKQAVLTYNTYNKSLQVDWSKNNKYTAISDFDENLNEITVWKTNSGTIALSGYYLGMDNKADGTYIVQLFNLTFNKGVLSNSITTDSLYKLSFSFQDNISYYIKNGNKFEELEISQSSHTFVTSPTDDNFYIYQKGADWSYPNTKGPDYTILAQNDTYAANKFPLYASGATKTEISKMSHISYTVYEKSAVKINYMYSKTDNSLKLIFTDKTIPEILEACSLPDNIKKYVHLTNLKYNR